MIKVQELKEIIKLIRKCHEVMGIVDKETSETIADFLQKFNVSWEQKDDSNKAYLFYQVPFENYNYIYRYCLNCGYLEPFIEPIDKPLPTGGIYLNQFINEDFDINVALAAVIKEIEDIVIDIASSGIKQLDKDDLYSIITFILNSHRISKQKPVDLKNIAWFINKYRFYKDIENNSANKSPKAMCLPLLYCRIWETEAPVDIWFRENSLLVNVVNGKVAFQNESSNVFNLGKYISSGNYEQKAAERYTIFTMIQDIIKELSQDMSTISFEEFKRIIEERLSAYVATKRKRVQGDKL